MEDKRNANGYKDSNRYNSNRYSNWIAHKKLTTLNNYTYPI